MRTVLRHVRRAGRLATFSVWFSWLVVQASVEVAADVLTPRSRLATGILAYRLECRSPGEISAFAALVNLTPGTLTIALRDAGSPVLYVHGMYAPDSRALDAELRRLETRFLTACRLSEDRP